VSKQEKYKCPYCGEEFESESFIESIRDIHKTNCNNAPWNKKATVKQVEIREGMRKIVSDKGWRGLNFIEAEEFLTKYLHSQGCVLKVDCSECGGDGRTDRHFDRCFSNRCYKCNGYGFKAVGRLIDKGGEMKKTLEQPTDLELIKFYEDCGFRRSKWEHVENEAEAWHWTGTNRSHLFIGGFVPPIDIDILLRKILPEISDRWEKPLENNHHIISPSKLFELVVRWNLAVLNKEDPVLALFRVIQNEVNDWYGEKYYDSYDSQWKRE